MALSTVLALIARSVATRVQRRLAQIAQVPHELQLVLRLFTKLIIQLEVYVIDRCFYLVSFFFQFTLTPGKSRSKQKKTNLCENGQKVTGNFSGHVS